MAGLRPAIEGCGNDNDNTRGRARNIGDFMLRMLVCMAALLLSGCASITGTQTQPVSIQATQGNQIISGATCTLTNDAGQWFVKTPGSVTVRKSTADLFVECAKDGVTGQVKAVSRANNNVWGNVFAGGLIGYAIDRNSGAGFDYPETVTVILGGKLGMMSSSGVAGVAPPNGSNVGTVSIDPSPPDGRWRAVMSCDANRFNKDSQPFQASFNAQVDGNRVMIRRRTKIAEEVMSGTISGESLSLAGMGYRLENPANSWTFKIDGVFMGNGKIYNGKGAQLAKNGTTARLCTVLMIHTDVPPPVPPQTPEAGAATLQ